jgi:hypothetical protein
MVLAPTWTRPLYDLVDKCLSRPEKGIWYSQSRNTIK